MTQNNTNQKNSKLDSKLDLKQNLKERIENAYKQIRAIYREKGLFQSFYTYYRIKSCPMKRIFHLIPEAKNYIDVGCGFGFMSLWTALVFPDANVFGMDIGENRITFANQLAKDAGIKNLNFLVKDITKESIQQWNPEIILLIDLFHHIPFESQFPFLQECIDKTPEGGYIIFKDIDRKPWWKFRVNYIQDYLFTRERTYSRHKDEYIAFFKEKGFDVEYFDLKKGYPYSHYLIRGKKGNRKKAIGNRQK